MRQVLTARYSSMQLITTVISSSTVNSELYSTFQCGSLITTPTWYIDGTKTVSTSGEFTGLASGMWVEWEKRDLSLFTPASAPILGYIHDDVNQTATAVPTQSVRRKGNTASNGLSVAAKAGIGVSVSCFILMLLGVALLWMRRHHQRARNDRSETRGNPTAELDPSDAFFEASGFSKRCEADSSFTSYAEKRSEREPVELDGNWHGHEVADTSGRSEKESASRSSSIVATPERFFRPSGWF